MGANMTAVVETDEAGEWEFFAGFPFFCRGQLDHRFRNDNVRCGLPRLTSGWPEGVDKHTVEFFLEECATGDRTVMTVEDLSVLVGEAKGDGARDSYWESVLALMRCLTGNGVKCRLLYAFDQ